MGYVNRGKIHYTLKFTMKAFYYLLWKIYIHSGHKGKKSYFLKHILQHFMKERSNYHMKYTIITFINVFQRLISSVHSFAKVAMRVCFDMKANFDSGLLFVGGT